MANKIVCVIPARLGSTRFPQKMLADLGGKPLVQWAYEGALDSRCFDQVVIAVDSQEVFDVAGSFGAKAVWTDSACQSGTERLIELQKKGVIEGDIWVNWQGDEPFAREAIIEELLQSIDSKEEEIWTLKRVVNSDEEAASPHVVKVVCDKKGEALYFSRSLIPYSGKIFKHVGLYAYRSETLEKISHFPPCALEQSEKLEQLRFLYNGLSIRVHETEYELFGIDTKEELAIAQSLCYTRH